MDPTSCSDAAGLCMFAKFWLGVLCVVHHCFEFDSILTVVGRPP